jgi:hypothetical protein
MSKIRGVAKGMAWILLALLFLAGAGGLALVPTLTLTERAFIIIVATLAKICLVARAIGHVRDAWRK